MKIAKRSDTPDCGPNAVAIEVEPSLSDEALEEIVQIAQKRAALIGDLKQALLQDDTEMIKRVAGRLCGVDNEDAQ
jgi:hypothetical protein